MGRIGTLATALLLVFATLAIGSAPAAVSSTQTVSAQAEATTLSAEEQEVVRLVNLERVRNGLWPLAVSPLLTASARGHNADMIANHFFSHTGSDGSTPSLRAKRAGFAPYGWGDTFVGENIAAGYQTPADVVAAWMSSPGHRANILMPEYREIGVGFSRTTPCNPYCTYWTQDFGSQPRVLPVFINDGAEQVVGSSVKVTLSNETVSSWGSIGPVQQVMLASDPSFAGASWQNYTQQLYWRLPGGTGAQAIYARLRDAQGQEVQSSDTVSVVPRDPSLQPRVFIPAVAVP